MAIPETETRNLGFRVIPDPSLVSQASLKQTTLFPKLLQFVFTQAKVAPGAVFSCVRRVYEIRDQKLHMAKTFFKQF